MMNTESLLALGIEPNLWLPSSKEPPPTPSSPSPSLSSPPQSQPQLTPSSPPQPVLSSSPQPQQLPQPALSSEPLDKDRTKEKRPVLRRSNRIKKLKLEENSVSDVQQIEPSPGNPAHPDLSKIADKDVVKVGHMTVDNDFYVVTAWLGTLKIFKKDENFTQVYSNITEKLITSIHCDDSKIYIAYIWGLEIDPDNARRPFLEVRALNGDLLYKPKLYSHNSCITHIQSDESFIYVNTRAPSSFFINLHRKDAFESIHYSVNFSDYTRLPIIASLVAYQSFTDRTLFILLSATKNSILVTAYSPLKQVIKHHFQFNDNFEIISFYRIDNLYIIHRSSIPVSWDGPSSKIELCFYNKQLCVLIHDVSLNFMSKIIQTIAQDNKLFLLGLTCDKTGQESYQLGCYDLLNLRPLWLVTVDKADHSSTLILQEKNLVVIFKGNMFSVKQPTDTRHTCSTCQLAFNDNRSLQLHFRDGHKSIFSQLTLSRNKYLIKNNFSLFAL